jgi:beta-galactosidase/beta-glucuronidase
LRDTALPTVGFKRKNDKRIHRDPKTRSEFLSLMRKAVKRLSFHPSVCYWTIFNEGWGQFDHAAAYGELKKLDPSRPIDSVSGWFSSREGTVSDVEGPHIYFKSIKLTRAEKPTVISEFGGYSYKVKGHSFNLKDNYGYGVCADGDELMKALTDLYENQVIPAISLGLCGTVYTQLTDVEDETNGLMTYDRRVTKVSPEGMRAIAERLYRAFENSK